MAVTAIPTVAQLQKRFGRVVLQFADDANTLSITDTDTAGNITEILEEATALALGILGNSWTHAEAAALAAADPSVLGAMCDIAISLLARRKPEFLGPDGVTLYRQFRKDAEAVLKQMALRERTPPGVQTAGENRTIGTDTNRPATALLTQATRANPRGPGGF